MRVISGQYKGRRLQSPRGLKTRPIADRVKAALFDWLGSRLAEPGRLPPVNVCDLFCGAGSQGIEAISRGAAFCAFVETDREALACLRRNLDQLGVIDEALIVDRSADCVTLEPPGDGLFDIIFVDPPYSMSEDVCESSIAGRVAAGIGTHIPTTPQAMVLWRHSDSCMLPAILPGGWQTVERRTWGTMAVTMLQKQGQVRQ